MQSRIQRFRGNLCPEFWVSDLDEHSEFDSVGLFLPRSESPEDFTGFSFQVIDDELAETARESGAFMTQSDPQTIWRILPQECEPEPEHPFTGLCGRKHGINSEVTDGRENPDALRFRDPLPGEVKIDHSTRTKAGLPHPEYRELVNRYRFERIAKLLNLSENWFAGSHY